MARFEVAVSADEYEATLRVVRDPAEDPPSAREVAEALAAKGVVHGVDPLAVEEARLGASGEPRVVARGEKVEIGKDAELLFRVDIREMRPEEREDGSVDHRELGLVKNVVRGQVLLEKVPARPGRPGRTVRGREVPIREVKDKDPAGLAGSNTAVTRDGLKLVSLIDGHVLLDRERRLSVSDTFVLGRSVDISTGNIRTNGHCVVKGCVGDGFVVEAKGDVTVHGDVEGAQIVSHEGSVTVMLGIRGHIKGEIRAGRSIRARFIENVRVAEAGEDVVVEEHILHSRVSARRRVVVGGSPGLVCGGRMQAVISVDCRELGAPAYTKTAVQVGDFTALPHYRRIAELKKQIYDLEVESAPLKKAVEEARTLVGRKDALALQRTEALGPLLEQARALLPRIEDLKREREQTEAKIPAIAEAQYLAVAGKVHPGVEIVFLRGPDEETVEVSKEASGRRWLLTPKGIKVKEGG